MHPVMSCYLRALQCPVFLVASPPLRMLTEDSVQIKKAIGLKVTGYQMLLCFTIVVMWAIAASGCQGSIQPPSADRASQATTTNLLSGCQAYTVYTRP